MRISASIILHLDMDAFFAQVEQLRDPTLKGKPVCVGGIPGKDRSVVASASYEARPYGIRAGTPLLQAQRLCPHAVFMRAHGGVYLEISRRVAQIMETFSDRLEPSSIDEYYLDVTHVLTYWKGAENLGRQLKGKIFSELQLTCSLGIAPTRILAKMGTDLHKPNGLTLITRENLEQVVFPLPVEKVPGIGPRVKAALNGIGIFNLGQLARADAKTLYKRFGVNGTRLQQIIRAELDWEVLTDDERPDEKSVGHSRTFGKDTKDTDELKAYLLSLVQMVGRRLREGELAGRTVALTIRYGDFHTITHRHSIHKSTDDENEIFTIAWRIFEEHYLHDTPVRLLGVSVSNLAPRGTRQMDLFDRKSRLYPAIDALKAKYGEGIIRRSSTLDIHLRSHTRNVNFPKPLTGPPTDAKPRRK